MHSIKVKTDIGVLKKANENCGLLIESYGKKTTTTIRKKIQVRNSVEESLWSSVMSGIQGKKASDLKLVLKRRSLRSDNQRTNKS